MQEKFEQMSRELPQLVGVGCEVRVNGLGYSVQRAKGTTDEPTVGDTVMSLGRTLLCLRLIERLRKGKASDFSLSCVDATKRLRCRDCERPRCTVNRR